VLTPFALLNRHGWRLAAGDWRLAGCIRSYLISTRQVPVIVGPRRDIAVPL
jgi:hypothetical protein